MAFGLVLIIYCMDVCFWGKSGIVRKWSLMTSFVTICLICSFSSVSGLGRTRGSSMVRFTCFIYLHCIMYNMWSFFIGVVPQALHVCYRRNCRSGLVVFVRLFDLCRFPTSREFTGIESHRLVDGS
ncbi:hypothetical protein JB92DRAFT_2977017, partial [Gautieria morchelliformis]